MTIDVILIWIWGLRDYSYITEMWGHPTGNCRDQHHLPGRPALMSTQAWKPAARHFKTARPSRPISEQNAVKRPVQYGHMLHFVRQKELPDVTLLLGLRSNSALGP